MGPIQVSDPGARYRAHREEIDEAVQRVLAGGRYILGEEVRAFEREFAGYLGVNHSIGVASGTDALHLALRACGVGSGDLVLTPSFTAVATVAAIELAGARPVFVDIDPASFTIDPNRIDEAIRLCGENSNLRPAALMAVHLYGHPCAMPAIAGAAARHGLLVIEDCAQSHGAAVDGVKTGAWGSCAAFSFYPTKNLGALGDGGAVATGDPVIAARLLSLRQYGWDDRRRSAEPGVNSRLDELQAAILRVGLRYLDSENLRRRELAALFSSLLEGTGPGVPQAAGNIEHVFHQYVIRTPARDDLKRFLAAAGVTTGIHYPVPVHRQPAYASRLGVETPLVETDRAAAEVLGLPVHPQLTGDQVREVARLVSEWSGS